MKPIEVAFAEWWQCTGMEGRVDIVQFNESRRAFYAGVEEPDGEPFDEVIWVIPNERTKTVNGSMLWFLCELYDKLEARTQGVTVTHAKALPRWLAAHWGRGAK